MQGFDDHVSRKVRTFPKKTTGISKDFKKSRQGALRKDIPKFSEPCVNDFQNYGYVEKKVKRRREERFAEDESEEDEEVDQDKREDQEEQEDQDEIVSAQFREDVANMPLSKVKELKNKLGIKLFNKAFFGVEEKQKTGVKEDQEVPTQRKTTQFKRVNSKRPREISSKKPVSKFRDIYANEKKTERISIDPRFDSRYGELNQAHFERNYTHIHELQLSEITNLKNELKEAKTNGDEARVREIKNTLKRMQDRERTKKDRDLKRQTVVQLRQENMKRMKEGNAPVFKTRADVRRLQDERKREVLQKEGNLDKHLERKEKKQKQKENRLKRKLTSEDHGFR